MSSPKLNNIIILGCILCYASVILLGLDARFLDLKGFGINCNVSKGSFAKFRIEIYQLIIHEYQSDESKMQRNQIRQKIL